MERPLDEATAFREEMIEGYVAADGANRGPANSARGVGFG